MTAIRALSVCLSICLTAASTAIQYQSYTRLNVADLAVTMGRRHTMSTWHSFSELPVEKTSAGQPSGHYNGHVFCYVLECNTTFSNITMNSRLLSSATWCLAVWYRNKQYKARARDFMFISERLPTRPIVRIALRQVMSHNLEHTLSRKVRSEVNGWRTFRRYELFLFLCVFFEGGGAAGLQ